jgi:L-iditol 2-dehydrogenase
MTIVASMLAAVHVGPNTVEVREFARPTVRPGDVLVQIDRAAICGSDLHNIFDGVYHPGYPGYPGVPTPGHPGHEAVGTVIETRSEDFHEGDRVLVLPTGSYAQYVAVPGSTCIRLPDDLPFDRALMAQQLGVCIFATQMFWPAERKPEGAAALLGAGSIGLFFLQLIRRLGFEHVIVSDLSPDRLDAASQLGAAEVVQAPGSSLTDVVMAATAGQGAELVVEAAGYDITRDQALRSVCRLGHVGLFGYPEKTGNASFPFYDLFWKGSFYIAVAVGAQRVPGVPAFHQALDMIQRDEIVLDHHLGVEYPLADMATALAVAHDRKVIKVQLTMG